MKESIQQDQGEGYPSELLVLIYQGKVGICSQVGPLTTVIKYNQRLKLYLCYVQVLKDELTIEDAKITESTFLVVMVSKVSTSHSTSIPGAGIGGSGHMPAPVSTCVLLGSTPGGMQEATHEVTIRLIL